MKLLRWSVCFILVAVGALFGSPYLIDWNARYSQYVFEQLGAVSGDSSITIKAIGNIDGSFVLPKLIVNNLYLECNEDVMGCSGSVSIDKLELDLSILSLIMNNPKIRAVNVHGLRTDLKSLANIVLLQARGGVAMVRIVDSAITAGVVTDSSSRNTVHIKNGLIKSDGQVFVTNAELRMDKSKYVLHSKLKLDKGHNTAVIELRSSDTEAILSGEGTGNEEAPYEMNWTLKVKAGNLSEFAQAVAVVADNSALRYVASAEELTLAGEIKTSKEGKIETSDLRVSSKSISGSSKTRCEANELCKVALDFDSVDLDALFQDFSGLDVDTHHFKSTIGISSFSIIPQESGIRVDLEAKEMRYRGELLKNLIVGAEIKGGSVSVDRLLLDLPGRNNHLYVNAVSQESSGELPKFVGNLDVYGDDLDGLMRWLLPLHVDDDGMAQITPKIKDRSGFRLESALYVAPRVFSLSNIRVITDSKASVTGNVKYKYGARGATVVGSVTASNFNIGGYVLSDNIDIKRDVTSFAWLRGVSSPVKLAVKFQDFTMESKVIKELSFLVDLSYRKMSLEKVRFSAEDSQGNVSDLEGSARVTLSSQGVRPQVFLSLKGRQYSDAFLWMPQLLVKEAHSEGNVGRERASVTRVMWSSKPIGLSIFEELDGNLEVRIGKLLLGQHVLSDLTWSSSLREGVMSVDELAFKRDDGEVKVSGNVGMGEISSLSLVLSVSNFAVGDMLSEDAKIRGTVSVSGSIQTQGKSLIEWANALKGKVKFAARGLIVQGVDFNELIGGLFSVEDKSEVASLAQIHLYKGSTFFEQFDGDSEISAGTLTSLLNFKIENAAGAASVNLFIPQFRVLSLFRFFFIPPGGNSPVHIDMNLQGPLWQPSLAFDINRLYEIARSAHAYAQ